MQSCRSVLNDKSMWFAKKSAEAALAGMIIPDHLLPTMESGYLLVDFAAANHSMSPGFAELFGVQEEISSLELFLDALPRDVSERLKLIIEELKQDRPVEPTTVELPLQSGKEGRGLYLSSHMLKDAAGMVTAAVVWMYDATAVIRNQQRLSQENAKLKGELNHHSTILNMAPYPIWERGADMQMRYCNVRYSEIVEDNTARQGANAIPELDKKEKILAHQALETGEPQHDRRYLIAGGERKLYQVSEFPVAEQQMVVGFGQDMSEIDEFREELQRYRSAQADLLESSASAMAIYGPDMRIQSFNYAFVNLWKLDEGWLETAPSYGEILENLRERRKLPEQANFQAFKQQQTKIFTELMEPREEFFYLPDGKTLRVIAITHALGGVLFAYEDVTDRLALERSYNTLIAVQRETLDNLHEGVAVFGEDGRLKLYNPVYLAMWGIPEDLACSEPHIGEVIGEVRKYYVYDDWDTFREQRIAQIQTRETRKYRIDRTDGKVIDCSTVPLPDGATLITFIDVTDSTVVERSLRERNEALQEADRLKTEFLANVSYELRSPLTSIAGFSDMLKQEYFGTLNEKQQEYVDGIYQSSQHLMQLVNDILDLASIEAGYMQLDVAKFDIAAALKSVLALVQERAKRQSLEVKLSCQAKIGKMTGDETRIKQILFNLLSNAVRFGNPGGKITLGAKVDDADTIVLWVEDDGPGIPEEEQTHIFNKFYKGKNANIPRAKSKGGTGLGLSIVKNFIELHGGSIELESTSGKTRFTCTLPRQGIGESK